MMNKCGNLLLTVASQISNKVVLHLQIKVYLATKINEEQLEYPKRQILKILVSLNLQKKNLVNFSEGITMILIKAHQKEPMLLIHLFLRRENLMKLRVKHSIHQISRHLLKVSSNRLMKVHQTIFINQCMMINFHLIIPK